MHLAFFGALLSLIWFIMVSLNLQYAIHIAKKASEIQDELDKELKGTSSASLEFVRPWLNGKMDWTLENIFWGTTPKGKLVTKKQWLATITKSTWFYRRLLPFILCLSWIFFVNIYVSILIAVIIVILFSFKFNPRLPQSPNDILWILARSGGKMGRNRLRKCTGMRYAEMDQLLANLAREGKIRIYGDIIKLL